MEPEKFIIGNEFVTSENIFDIKNPYLNKTVKRVYKSSKADVNNSLNYLTSVQKKYRKLPVYLKAELLEKISDKIKQKKEDLANLITLETGKPLIYSKIEIDRAVLTFKLGAELSKQIEGEVLNLDLLKGSENKTGIVKRFPVGVVLAITPWNFPINLVAHKISPALASGNTVLLKPASASMSCGIEIGKIIKESADELSLGFTPVNVVTSSGSEIESFASDSRVNLVSFTGSSAVGWKLKSKLVYQKVSLELGGNAGVIVDDNSDLELAAKKLSVGGFAQAGQSCISVQRIYVVDSVYEKFISLFTDEVKKIKFGNPFEEDTIVGPMINEEEAIRVERWTEEAVNTNGTLLLGGARTGAMFEPTILTDINENANVNSKEVFAPLVTVRKIKNFTEAVENVNKSQFGLQAGVFTNDIKNAFYAFDNIETGGVIINDVSAYRMDSMPYGGVKMSGNTREGVKYAIDEMTELKIMVI